MQEPNQNRKLCLCECGGGLMNLNNVRFGSVRVDELLFQQMLDLPVWGRFDWISTMLDLGVWG